MPRFRNALVITYSARRRRRKVCKSVNEKPQEREIELATVEPASNPTVCQFCLSSEENEVDLGPFHEKNGVTVHYYCMLLSSGLIQTTRPSDRTSLLGFTLPDISRELRRGNRLTCCFCHKKGATIGCNIHNCRKAFHLSCGRQNGTMHLFFDTYKSFCAEHWSHPGLEMGSPLRKRPRDICSICQTSFGNCKLNDIISTPCCKRTYFHHRCIQKYALSAGMHYFKCPLCNASKDFQKAMLLNGIFIPDRDASWEREPNAFQELLDRPDTCSISPCICAQGEKYNAKSGNFRLLICESCGSYCAHKACAGLPCKAGRLICPDCTIT
ncbi:G2/m phase-specific e3 ubiquitin-protein ligase [Plakobranchus ocellatus]|uniref:G2/m phase-specific e3 ubiquitin-protein ligase n=1 Tax=Plakobranchus ocellatus TaxID=259542 RepID=A0AAV4ALB3_9GAST|nr:G2/m phase-specific e3 ubiquitin-protein ligase [Plakobranchus ocellatus]